MKPLWALVVKVGGVPLCPWLERSESEVRACPWLLLVVASRVWCVVEGDMHQSSNRKDNYLACVSFSS